MSPQEERRRPPHPGVPLPRGSLELLVALVSVVILPHAYQPDVVKEPLLVAGTVILLAWFVLSMMRGGSFTLPPSSILIPGLLFWLLASGFSLRGTDPHAARDAALLWSAFGICFLLGCSAFVERVDVDRFFSSLSVLALLVSAIGLLQLSPWGVPGLVFMMGNDGRIPSTLGSPSILGGFSAGLLPVALVSAGQSRGSRRTLHAAAACGLVVMLIASGSRCGIAAAIGGLTVLAFLLRGEPRKAGTRSRWLAPAAALFITLLIVLIAPLRERFLMLASAGGGTSVARRLVIWESAWHAFLASPWTGHGTGSFVTVLPLFRDPLYWRNGTEDLILHAHNEALEIGVEFGVAGVILWGIILIGSLVQGAGSSRKGNGGNPLAAALTAGLCAMLFDNIAGISLRSPPVGAIAWLFMGMLWSGAVSGGPSLTFPEGNRTRRVAGVAILAAALLWGGLSLSRQIPRFSSERHMLDGILAATHGDAATSQREFLEAARVDPGNLQALSASAPVWLLRDDPVRALEALDALQLRAPFFPRSNLTRARALLVLGRLREADAALANELRLRRAPESLLLRSRLALAAGDTALAQEADRQSRALESDPAGR